MDTAMEGAQKRTVPLTSNWDASLTYDALDMAVVGRNVGESGRQDGRRLWFSALGSESAAAAARSAVQASAPHEEPVFVGREELLGPLVNAIAHPTRRGTYLVSGYRGAGKTSLVIEAARQGRERLAADNWRLLPLVLNVSEVSASLDSASPDGAEPHGLRIDARRLLTALLRALRNAVAGPIGDFEQLATVADKVRHAYLKAEAAQYTEKQRLGQERILSELREVKAGLDSADVLKPVGALALIAAAGVEGVALVGSGLAALHVVAATLAGGAALSLGWSATHSRSEKSEDISSLEFVRDNSLHQLERDLKDILSELHHARLRPIIILEELDKVEDKQGQQLDAVIRYFKNLFTQAPALFFFLTDKDYFDLVASRIQAAREKRSYSVEHTFFTHRVFVKRPRIGDCLQYLEQVFTREEDRDVIRSIAEADRARVRQYEDMSELERFVRVLLFRSQAHVFDLKNEMRRYVQVGSDGQSALEWDPASLPEAEQRLAAFQFLIEQKFRSYELGGGRDYVNEVLRSCLYAPFFSLGATEPQPVARFQPTRGPRGDQLTLDEERAVNEAVNSLLEDLERGDALRRVPYRSDDPNAPSEPGFAWLHDAAVRFRAVARLEPHERELADALARWSRVAALFGSGGRLHGVVDVHTDDLRRAFEQQRQDVEELAEPLPREEALTRRHAAERDASLITTPAVDAHVKRLQDWGLSLVPLPTSTTFPVFEASFPMLPGIPAIGQVVVMYAEPGAANVEEVAAQLATLRKADAIALVIVWLEGSADDGFGQAAEIGELEAEDWSQALEAAGFVLSRVVGFPIHEEVSPKAAASRWGVGTATEALYSAHWLRESLPAVPSVRADAWILRTADGTTGHPAPIIGTVGRWLDGDDQVLLVPPLRDTAMPEVIDAAYSVLSPFGRIVVPVAGALLSFDDFLQQPDNVPAGAANALIVPLLALLADKRAALFVDGADVPGQWLATVLEGGTRVILRGRDLPSTYSSPTLAVLWHVDESATVFEVAPSLREDYPDVSDALTRAAAEAGNIDAMLELAVALEPDDEGESLRWQERLLASGGPDEVTRLALRLRNRERRIAVYRTATERGDASAMVALGDLIAAMDRQQALDLYREAARRGDAGAMRRLVVSLADERLDESLAWQKRLAATGDTAEIRQAAEALRNVDPSRAADLGSSNGPAQSSDDGKQMEASPQ